MRKTCYSDCARHMLSVTETWISKNPKETRQKSDVSVMEMDLKYDVKPKVKVKLCSTRRDVKITTRPETLPAMSVISSSPDDPVIRIVLMGRNASGKSSSGIILLGKNG
ncbi:hypothetical protein QQF64_025964 [Cirrhinus molitorella]|uniref:Uncharacterized protein n=1 Tax=Cirrhinus molitorella TaxID=172907 RepID=A0ABR3NRR6_9TELE